jgi:hypothetical protein
LPGRGKVRDARGEPCLGAARFGIATPVIAYVGEVMRRVSGGRWTAGPATNEPMIAARDGRLLQPFALVVVPMVEPSKRVALRAGVDVLVMGYRAGAK